MKKTLVSALTTALVVGAASTTFAASNPFSDVPAAHWAYDAVAQLAADGVIEGYGDTTFRGNQSITRYEMAQMVAKAMAKTDVSAADKALIDKLAAEFSDELNNLGVRVSNLERNADMVKWNGQARYTYRSLRTEQENGSKDRDNSDKLLLRLEPSAEVNDHWHVNARLDATTEMSDDKGDGDNHDEDKITLKRVYAQGNYKNFQTQLGKFGLYTPEQGLVFDSDNSMSGANVTFGNALKATIYAGRIDVSDQEKGYQLSNRDFDDTANMQGITLQYATPASKWSGGAAYYHLNTNDFIGLTDGLNNGEGYTNGKNDEDNANICLQMSAITSTIRAVCSPLMPTTRAPITSTNRGRQSTATRALSRRTRTLGVLMPRTVTSAPTRRSSARKMPRSSVQRAGKSVPTTLRSTMYSLRLSTSTARASIPTATLTRSGVVSSSSSNLAIL